MNKKVFKYINKNIHKDFLVNKTIIITGGNSGIGFEVAKICCYLKMNIVLAVRDVHKGETAKRELLSLYPSSNIKIYELDVSKRQSIIDFKNNIIGDNIDINMLYLNAGVFKIPHSVTEDGYETVMATNYLGNYLLISEFSSYLSNLNHEVKIIITTSVSAFLAKLDCNDFFMEKKYDKWKIYARSKLADIHLYLYLKEKCANRNIIPFLVHPGACSTPLISKAFPKWFSRLATSFASLFFHSSEKASLCTIRLLDDRYLEPTFIGPRGLLHISGYPKETKIPSKNKIDYEKTVVFTAELLNTPLLK